MKANATSERSPPPVAKAAQDNILLGRAELPLCPEFIGGAAAPPCRQEFCPAPGKMSPLFTPSQQSDNP
jgi:hypothetical protein